MSKPHEELDLICTRLEVAYDKLSGEAPRDMLPAILDLRKVQQKMQAKTSPGWAATK